MCGWSRGSMLESSNVAASASVGDHNEGRVEDVCLQSTSDEPLDVLAASHEDLSPHMAALLGAWLLVLDVNACGAVLNEHLRELHRRREPAVASVSIRDDWVQKVHWLMLGAILW